MDRIAEDRRRVALFLPDMGVGGAERVALALLQGFVDRGFAVDLVLASQHGPLLALVPDKVEIIDLHAPKLRQIPFALARYLRHRRPAALHAMMWPMPLLAIIARIIARAKTRIVISEHTTLSTVPHALRHRIVRSLTRRAYLKADALLAVSAGVADDMAPFIGLPRGQIEVIYNPLQLPADLPPVGALAGRWPAGTRRLLAVGELKFEKNYPLLLRALVELRRNVPASLLIVGGGSLHAELQREVAALDLQDAVVFVDFVNDVWPYYRSAELFVLSSDIEGFGNVLVEAMHAGIPVVTTDCPSGPREILDDGRFGTLVPCGDEDALAQALADGLIRPVDPAVLRRRAAELSGEVAIDKHVAILNVPA
jgi:glycosyltransferase involved in cell wall biosynthesis